MAVGEPGKKYTYNHEEGHGFGRHHAGEDLLAEMRDLDMPHGTEVTVLVLDEDSGWPVVQWTDGQSNDRITTVDPAFFDTNFTEA